MDISMQSVLDHVDLTGLAREHKTRYQAASPFPHIIIDNFLPETALQEVAREFPDPNQVDWTRFENGAEKKLATKHEKQMPPATRALMHQLNSSTFIDFLEELTGIQGLIPDPHFWGGGLHQIQRGGFLKVHADFNHHPRLKLDRRLNLLIYLNDNWKEEYGGHLELWDREMKKCEARVLPLFNRCVVFSTTDFSYHGHPDALTCPEGRARRSLALYYYSNGRPAEERGDAHNTLFRERPGEEFLESVYGKPVAAPAPVPEPEPATPKSTGFLSSLKRSLLGGN
jgi:hypothetical protein